VSGDLAPLFAPRRVAVLGVSRRPEKLGHRLLQNLLAWEFPGQVFPVNPSGEAILGLPAVVHVRELPEELDLALVSLPAASVVEAVRDLGARRCRAAVVLTSGFAETGEAGRAVQAELARAAHETGMRIVGPNCMGMVDVPGRLNGSYFWDVPRRPGGVSFVSQSGAYGGLFFREMRARGLGVARFVSIGNQADVGFVECLEFLLGDPATRVVALFVEGIREGRRFVEAAGRLSRAKPVVAFKVGRGGAGRRAAGSHTGSLAGEYAICRAAFEAAGLVVATETEEFFDGVAALDAHAARLPAGDGVAILTVSGGPSVAAADAAEAAGLRVPALPEPLRARLAAHLPAFGATGNPVDFTPQTEAAAYAPAVRLVLEADEIAGAVMIDVGLDHPAYGEAVVAAQAASGKPVVACTVDTPEIDQRLAAAAIPVLPTPERAVRAYRALWVHAGRRQTSLPAPRPARALPAAVARALAEGRGPLPHTASRPLLECYGVAFPPEGPANSVAEALSVAARIGYPVVVKTTRPDLTHKTEAGGVLLGVAGEAALREAAARLLARFGPGLLVQRQVEPGVELLVGGRQDPVFGPTVAFGLGGVLAELWGEVTLGLAPLGAAEAARMLHAGRAGALVRGFRGAPPCDEGRLAAVLTGIGDLLVDHPEIVELDVNPLVARGAEATAVDVLTIVDHTADGGRHHA
jgi:acetate---CoA ligase (ADP-forming)